MMGSLAVVILNYNGKAHLEKFLPGVVKYSPEAKVIVADNGSDDDSLNFISKNFPGVEVIVIGKNLGFCGGYNHALKSVDADYFLLLNNDVDVTDGWLRPLLEIMEGDNNIAAIQPKILSYHQKNRFEYAGAGGGLIDILGYPFCRGRIFDTTEEDHGQYNDTLPVFWATGACLMVRAKLFNELGGFDEDFFAHMEEIDLCWRLKRRRYKVYYCGSSTVYHVGGGTLAAVNPAKTYYNFRNGLDMLIKNQPGGSLVWKFPLRLALDWVAAARFLLGTPAHAWAVVRAHWHVATHIGRILSKRRKLKDTGFEVTEIYPAIILWRYFVVGRKHFH
jgi:GT2 family glycosyltransferase